MYIVYMVRIYKFLRFLCKISFTSCEIFIVKPLKKSLELQITIEDISIKKQKPVILIIYSCIYKTIRTLIERV